MVDQHDNRVYPEPVPACHPEPPMKKGLTRRESLFIPRRCPQGMSTCEGSDAVGRILWILRRASSYENDCGASHGTRFSCPLARRDAWIPQDDSLRDRSRLHPRQSTRL